jgi:hypothetical protein
MKKYLALAILLAGCGTATVALTTDRLLGHHSVILAPRMAAGTGRHN